MAIQHTYETLRCAYNTAFHRLARETQHLRNGDASAAQARIAAAQRCYLEARNALADYLLARRGEAHAVIQQRAYFLWEDAGRPSGNDQAYWYRAKSRLLSGTFPPAYSSR